MNVNEAKSLEISEQLSIFDCVLVFCALGRGTENEHARVRLLLWLGR
jgi:hypothetical protein